MPKIVQNHPISLQREENGSQVTWRLVTSREVLAVANEPERPEPDGPWTAATAWHRLLGR